MLSDISAKINDFHDKMAKDTGELSAKAKSVHSINIYRYGLVNDLPKYRVKIGHIRLPFFPKTFLCLSLVGAAWYKISINNDIRRAESRSAEDIVRYMTKGLVTANDVRDNAEILNYLVNKNKYRNIEDKMRDTFQKI